MEEVESMGRGIWERKGEEAGNPIKKKNKTKKTSHQSITCRELQ
jgi:hypothetical protein